MNTRRMVEDFTTVLKMRSKSMPNFWVLWIREVLQDLHLLLPGPSMMWCDSKSAVAMAFDPVAFKNTKHILRAAEFLKHHTLCGSVTINHTKGVIMIADILTKGQARPIFLQLLKLLDDYSKNSIIELTD